MLIKIAKNNLLFQYILLGVLSLVLWGKTFLATGFADAGSWISWAICLITATGFGLIASKHSITRNPGLLASVFLCMFSPIVKTAYTPDLWVCPLFLPAFYYSLDIYGKEHPYPAIFNATFFWSAATVFYPDLLFTLPCFWCILLTYAVVNWRMWATSLIGMGTPWLLVFACDFLFHTDILQQNWAEARVFSFPAWGYERFLPDLLLLFCMFISLLSVLSFRRYLQDLEINERRKSSALITLFVYLSVFNILSGNIPALHRFPLLIPLAFFCTKFILNVRRDLTRELIFGFILVAGVFATYF